MRLRFKHQKFQADAAKAVVDVFAGQPYLTPSYMIDRGNGFYQQTMTDEEDFTGWSNHKILPELSDRIILENLQKVQRTNQLKPSEKLEGHFNLTIEMETGVGKTYTYIKTMYELNKHYGWSKFIVVVPSIAIREGVYKSFQVTQEHFAEEYGKKVRFFIYNSAQLTEIDRFASDNSICAMIINSQAFNARGKDARRISMKLDEFRSRRPIDIIAKTNPILIIDEPQSVEGKQTKENLKQFNPLLTLRYSATHKSDSIYNMVYRLDAMEAYNKRLVKKIAVKGISESGSTATESYVYLESINLSKAAPTATIQFDYKGASGIRKITRTVSEGYNLYDNSGSMEEYKQGFVVSRIDGRDDSVEFLNGIKIYAGDVIGKVSEDQLRRIQIRETILSHIQRERELFYKGIKVLSLFFIDEVAKYRVYDEAGQATDGIYAQMFVEEYNDIIESLQIGIGEDDYMKYLQAIPAEKTHAGYFSIDKKGKMIDSKVGRKETTTDDVDAYELIMKNKELLLDRDPKRSPVRFIFSHSALREGWDNPNVFQICTLKDTGSEIKKRQEVGRGMRLCVNKNGERQDQDVLGDGVFDVNILTVIASESYEHFSKQLQSELAEDVADRPAQVTAHLFEDIVMVSSDGKEIKINRELACEIHEELISNGYVKKGKLTEKYFNDKKSGTIDLGEELNPIKAGILGRLDTIFNPDSMKPDNARKPKVATFREDLFKEKFTEVWKRINVKTYYKVDFSTDELIKKAIESIDKHLSVTEIRIVIEGGSLENIRDKESLQAGVAMTAGKTRTIRVSEAVGNSVRYDLVGDLVNATGLTRKTIVEILKGIKPATFAQFKMNPEEFIIKTANIINDAKAIAVIQKIAYERSTNTYDMDIFTESTIRGKLGINALESAKSLYDIVVVDSLGIEKNFAEALEKEDAVEVYTKLPRGFYINTPMGHYNPDWAVAFKEGTVKHIYFIAETKGNDWQESQLRGSEDAKIECARRHFAAISDSKVVYGVAKDYQSLYNLVTK